MTHRIVEEELELLASVREILAGRSREARLGRRGARSCASSTACARRWCRGRGRRPAGAADQYNRQEALLRQLRARRDGAPVDPRSPYFGHLRLREKRRVRRLPRQGHLHRRRRAHRRLAQRADLAPVLPLPAGRRVRGGARRADAPGEVAARRTVASATASSNAIDAPEGVFRADGARRLGAARREPPRLAGGEGSGAAGLRRRRGATAPARRRPAAARRSRRQASARHRRPHRPGPVRADHPRRAASW